MEHSLPHFGFGLWIRNLEALGVTATAKTCLMSLKIAAVPLAE